ncbi:hypothetical protein BDF21DRAFT_434941 [Thamnidium elegans]|nr:hypothetical protein BDF21DRAFT_434941 [Thamnidium elegans]
MNQDYRHHILSLHFFKIESVASLRFNEPISLEHTTEEFRENLYLDYIKTFKTSQDIPYMIFIVYHKYSSSFYLKVKAVGDGENGTSYITALRGPMSLCRS